MPSQPSDTQTRDDQIKDVLKHGLLNVKSQLVQSNSQLSRILKFNMSYLCNSEPYA
jgi:hypothetical protein